MRFQFITELWREMFWSKIYSRYSFLQCWFTCFSVVKRVFFFYSELQEDFSIWEDSTSVRSLFTHRLESFFTLTTLTFWHILWITCIILCIYIVPDIGLAVRVFANGLGDLGSIPGRVIPKTQKMVLDASLLNTQHYKVRIKGKVEQSRERSSALPYTLV